MKDSLFVVHQFCLRLSPVLSSSFTGRRWLIDGARRRAFIVSALVSAVVIIERWHN
jgi:hypothetical protein